MTVGPAQRRPPAMTASVYAVFRHELRTLLYAPLTYIFQLGFLLILTVCIFLIADFFDSDEASLRLLLVFVPWIALVFAPALAMRAWADEQNDRGFELALTLPLSVPALVLGKFLAGAAVLLITLAFSCTYPATVAYLGDPDTGVLLAGYLATGLLLCAFYAVALFGAALARDQTGAFVIGVSLIFVLLLLGWDALSRMWSGAFAAGDLLAAYGPKRWLDMIGHGRLHLGALGYFVLLTALSLTACGIVITRRRTATAGRTAPGGALWMAGLALCGMLLPPQLERLRVAFDVTREREFTLSSGTLSIAKRLPEGVELDLFWSATQQNIPQSISAHARRVSDLLAAVAAAAGGRIRFAEIDPQPDTDAELTALGAGVQRIPMTSGDYFYLGAAVRHGERRGQISYFDPRRDRLAEYDIAVLLNNLTRSRTAKVGVISPLLAPGAALQDREGLSFMSELRRAYDIAVIPYFTDSLPEGLDVLLLINPGILKRDMLRAVDAFVQGGGSLIAMLDPFVRFDPASNQLNPSPSAEINDLSDLLAVYGVTYVADRVVGDGDNAAPVQGMGQDVSHYPYWLRLPASQLSAGHPVTAGLNELLFAEAGAWQLDDASRATVLATSGQSGSARAREDFSLLKPEQLARQFTAAGERNFIAAVLRGPFGSAFDTQTARPRGAEAGDGARVFVVADVDWLFDPFSVQAVEVGGQAIVRPLNDNLALLLNMIEFAAGDPALIAIRSRGQVQRPFTRVIASLREAGARYRERENALANQIAAAEEQIEAFARRLGVTDISRLRGELRNEVQRVQRELLPLRRELREVRRAMRESVDALSRRLTLVNLLSGPLMVLGFFLLVRGARRAAARAM